MSIIPLKKGTRTMKKNGLFVVLSILMLGIFLTSCSNASTTTSWGGVSASDSAAYFTNTTTVLAVNAENGTLIWSYPEKASNGRFFYAAPVVAGDQLIVGDYVGAMVALGIKDGKELWKFADAKGHFVNSPLVINDLIIAPNSDANVYALDMDGNLVWKYSGTHAFWATPVSDGTNVYVTSLDHYIYDLDLKTGNLIWKTDLNSPIVGSPLLADDGTLYVGTLDNSMYALQASDGSQIWKQTVSGGVWSQPILTDGNLYFGDASGKINVLAAADGKSVVQSLDMQSAILGNGVLVGDHLVFGDEAGDVIYLGKEGSRVATPSVSGSVYSNLVFANGHLYVLSTKGDKPLYAFDENGAQVWSYSSK
jgi:outer membrane protein assembly factor BamB